MTNQLQIALLAVCLLALATAGVSCQPASGLTPEVCVKRLAEALKGVAVPQPVLDLTEWVASELPYDNDLGWSQYEDKVRSKYMSQYPNKSCEKFVNQVEEIFAADLTADQCGEILENEDADMQKARSDPVLGPVMRAKEACFAFEPHTPDEGLPI